MSAARKGVAAPAPSEPTVASAAYLTKGEVAKRLGVRPRTVGQWAKLGKLPAYRIGPYLRFKWAEIESHLGQTCRVRASEIGGQHA